MGKLNPLLSLAFILIATIILPQFSRSDITIEVHDESQPILHYPDCDKVEFKKPTYVSCICFKGIWALETPTRDQSNKWYIVGGERDKGDSKCLHVGQWINKLKRISDSSLASTISQLEPESNTFVITNSLDWEIQLVKETQEEIVSNEGGSNKRQVDRYCLPGSIAASYCLYNLNIIPSNHTKIKEKDFNPHCTQGSLVLTAIECQAFSPSIFENYPDVDLELDLEVDLDLIDQHASNPPFVCNLIPPRKFQKNQNTPRNPKRMKRQDNAAPPPPDPAANAPSKTAAEPKKPLERDPKEIDEDYIRPEYLANFKGEDSMMNSITTYMLSEITKMVELNGATDMNKDSGKGKGSKKGRKKREVFELPVTNLLRLSGNIMKETCTAVDHKLLTIAMESFLIQQKTVYQLKEPYIGYAPYQRILKSLEKCAEKATPIRFMQNDTNPPGVMCETKIPSITNALVFDVDRVEMTVEVPAFAVADVNLFEPIIEIAWKMFVFGHAICYRHFTDYYNDHHTYTVSIMQFFTNQIQDIWFLGNSSVNGTDTSNIAKTGSAMLDYSTENIWYGNILGNVSKLYYDLDKCYSAVRQLYYEYPWFMNRPPRDLTNQWSRKKRDVPTLTDQTQIDNTDSNFLKMSCEPKSEPEESVHPSGTPSLKNDRR